MRVHLHNHQFKFETSRSSSCMKVIGSRSRSQEQTAVHCPCVLLGSTFEAFWPETFIFGIQVNLYNLQVKFEADGWSLCG